MMTFFSLCYVNRANEAEDCLLPIGDSFMTASLQLLWMAGSHILQLISCAIPANFVDCRPLRMHFIRCQDGARMEHAEAITLSKFCNMSSVLVHCDSAFVDSIKALVNYASGLYLECGVKFVEERIKWNVDNTLSSEKLPTRMPAIYMRYMQPTILCITESALPPSL